MRVLVTGGSGFIGTNLVSSLAREHEVLSLDINAPREARHHSLWKRLDIRDRNATEDAFARFAPEVVFHLAARTDLGGVDTEDYSANTEGVSNVISGVAAVANEVRTIYASSRLVFAIDHNPLHDFDYKPSTVYGESKIISEEIILREASSAGPWCIVRPTSIWGPWFSTPYRDFFDTVAQGKYVSLKNHNPQKSFGFVGNAVHQLTAIAEAPIEKFDRQVFWLTDYPPLVLSEWADLIADALQVKKPQSVPFWLLWVAAALGDVAQKAGMSNVPLTSFRLKNLITRMVYDTTLLESVVGPLPYTLKEGVQETATWYHGQKLV